MRTSIYMLYQDLIVGGRLAAIAVYLFAFAGMVLTLSASMLILVKPGNALAVQTVPYLINFQGRLTDNNGNVMSDGSYNVKFRLYNVATGGTALWAEDRVAGSPDNRISVQNGLFNIQLGSLSTLSANMFNSYTEGTLYLEVELPTPATATCASSGCAVWTEGAMTPRQPLASSPYAINSDNLDGLNASAFVQLSPGSAQTGSINVSGSIQSGASLQGTSATLTGTDSLTLGTSTALGQITFGNGTNSNTTILQSGSTGPPGLTLTLPSATGSSGDCLKDTNGTGQLGFSNCGSSVTLQSGYNNSTGPPQITTTSAEPSFFIQSGTSNNSTAAFAVLPSGTSTPTLDVDTTNSRVGINTLTPSSTLDVELPSASSVTINSATAPTTDQVVINNTASTGVATANANGLHINYAGGAGVIQAAGLRVDYTPGSTSGSTWSGLRVVAGATGAATGVASYGIKLEGPTTDGSGTDVAVEVGTGWDIGLDVQSGGLQLASQADPATPASGNIRVYASESGGRTLLEVMGSSGRSYPLQPSLFSNNVVMINASGGATAPNAFGTTLTSAASQTISHPTATPAYGFMTNFASSTAATFQAGTSMNGLQFMRGSTTGDAGGFFFMDRLAFPDASYSQSGGTTGSRIFSGMSDQTLSTSVSSDNPTGNRAGFSFVSNSAGRKDTDWQFTTKNGTTENLVDTGMPFTATDAYDLYAYCPVQGTTIYWEIDNMTPGVGTVKTGSVTADLPGATTAMRGIEALMDLDSTHVVRNLRAQRMYVESDR